jgi:hypothetical protein
MPNSQTPASKRRRAENATAWNSAQEAAGWKLVGVMLSPESLAALDRLVERYGTRKTAIAAAIEQAADNLRD